MNVEIIYCKIFKKCNFSIVKSLIVTLTCKSYHFEITDLQNISWISLYNATVKDYNLI